MPIRLPDIPGVNSSPINAPGMNARAAAAPALALGDVAQSIANAGETFHGIAMQTQKLENARIVSQKRQELARDYADFNQELQSEVDPAARIRKTQEFLSAYKGRMEPSDVPDAVRDELGNYYDGFATQRYVEQSADAARLQVQRTEQAFDNEIGTALDTGDTALAIDALDRFAATGAITPEQHAAKKSEIEKKGAEWQMDQAMLADPSGFLETYPADSPPLGMDPMTWARKREQAKGILRDETYEDVQTLTDAIVAGDITTPEDLESKAGHLRPTVQDKLQGMLSERAQEGYKAMVATPEYQNSVVGKVSAMLADYNPEAEDYDENFVEMDGLVTSLPPGAVKDELTRRITGVRSGKLAEIKTHADIGMKALDDAHKAGRFGQPAKVDAMKTSEVMAAGFLADAAKLESLGFSEDQVEAITKETSNAARARIFRQEWTSRGVAAEDVSRDVWNSAMAIRQGLTTVPNPEAEDAAITATTEAERRYGAAKTSLADWLKVNPNAPPEKIEEQIFKLAGEEARKAVHQGILETKPTRSESPKGADDSTSAIPMGKDIKTIVKHFEAGGAPGGFHEKAYWDFGQWSIGYGTKSRKGEVISKAEGEKRLDKELASHRGRVETYAAKAGLAFTDHELDALTSFDYNTGRIETLLANGTRSKQEIADKMLLYRNAGGKRLAGLEKRRQAERHVFLKGYA